jgi:hypothetical protein
MNLEQLQKQSNQMVKLRPSAQYVRSPSDSFPVDWNWRIAMVDKKQGRVQLEGNHYVLTLMSDHIKEFMHSSDREFVGFLILKVDIFIQGNNITLEPLMRQP